MAKRRQLSVLDPADLLQRNPFEVERCAGLRGALGIGRQRDARREELLSELRPSSLAGEERATLLCLPCVQRREQELEQLGHRRGLEDDRVSPGLELRRL